MALVAIMLLAGTLEGAGALAPLPEGVELRPSEIRQVEARWGETIVRGAPWVPHRRIGTVAGGTRLAVRGEVDSRDAEGCHGKPWYAVYPYGFVCSEHVRPAEAPPSVRPALPVAEGRRVPFNYAWVRENGAPMYGSQDEIRAGTPQRPLEKGMSLVVQRTVEVDGREYVQTWDGRYVPRPSVRWGGQGSEWRGVDLSGEPFEPGPAFAWVSGDRTRVYREPRPDAAVVDKLGRRERVPLLEHHVHPVAHREGLDFYRIGEGRWVRGDGINEVHVRPPPRGVLDPARVSTTGNEQWIDVDVGEQVLVAYRGTQPVFATLISSGKGNKTPLGNYPIWAKVAAMDMGNQDYEDSAYLVQGVPWVLLFQGHNALHGAYWHDRFGQKKSHGCVNLAPQDARWVFEWVAPVLLEGWTGYLPGQLERSVVVHVRDSSRPEGLNFTQERPIGPPDRDAERERSLAAQARREAEAASQGQAGPEYRDPYDPRPTEAQPSTTGPGGTTSGDGIPPDSTPRGPRLGSDGRPLPPAPNADTTPLNGTPSAP